MKTVLLNGSPRKNWNTAQLLRSAQKGAETAGAETEYIDLYELNYSGCRSCLACKRKGAAPCRCYWKDDLTPVLERIWQADRLITGTPIYYSEPTGGFRSFMERITFPCMSYGGGEPCLFKGHINVDIFLTMNAPMEYYQTHLEQKLRESLSLFRFLNGNIRIFPVCDTLQVKDYSKYDMAYFSEEHKKAIHEAEFPKELEKAFNIGAGKNR